MNHVAAIALLILCFSMFAHPQTKPVATPSPEQKSGNAAAEIDLLAKTVFAAHGGDRLKKIKTLVVRGSVDVTSSAFQQAIAGGFSTVMSGNKYILDIQTPFQSLKQVSDGENTSSSIPGITLPPVNSLGFPLLPKYGDAGYTVSLLPEAKRKQKGFRLTGPDGFFTDFFIDEKSNLIKGYESSYEFNGRSFSTSVEIDKNRIVDGITIPEKYSQRFDLGGLTAYSSFKAKEILINSAIDDAVFSVRK